MRQLASRLGLGRLLLHCWYRPKGWVSEVVASGGPFEMRATERGRNEMATEAERLAPLESSPQQPTVTLHILTGRRYWFQTAFCLQSLVSLGRTNVQVELYDDGSFDEGLVGLIRRYVPRCQIHLVSETRERIERLLPDSRFPALRERWNNYPNIRKLIDPHLGSTGWKLVLDSDILFFREPRFLTSWSQNPSASLHTVDCQESYGYSRQILEQLAGRKLPERVNVGVCGLLSETLDWERLEFWCHQLIVNNRPSYYLEQALVAMLLAGQKTISASADEYVTRPTPPEALNCHAVMHHYVAESKRWYFQQNWRRILAAAGSTVESA